MASRKCMYNPTLSNPLLVVGSIMDLQRGPDASPQNLSTNDLAGEKDFC